MSNQDYIKIDFSSFPDDDRFAQIPGKFFVVDNLNPETDDKYKHRHPNYPVQVTMAITFICMRGFIEMSIGLQSYTLKANQSVLIIPGTFFQIKNVSDDNRCVFMAISPGFVNYTQDIKLGVEFGRMITEHPIHIMDEEEIKELLMLYGIVKKKLMNPDFQFKEDIVRSFLSIVKCNILQQFIVQRNLEREEKPSNRKEEIFFSFMSAVREYYKQNRNIGFYAEKLFMSPKYLSSVVHDVSGKYATEWINEYVILEAKAMLRSPGISVKDVTNNLNFANQSFFAKYFKQHTGYTPREYMNM